MPRSSNHLALARRWEMLKRLPNRAQGITARELADSLREDGLEVTKRTEEPSPRRLPPPKSKILSARNRENA